MSQSSKKLFTPEDFDKEPKTEREGFTPNERLGNSPVVTNANKSKTWLWWLCGGGVITAVVVCLCLYSNKEKSLPVIETGTEVIEEVVTTINETIAESPIDVAEASEVSEGAPADPNLPSQATPKSASEAVESVKVTSQESMQKHSDVSGNVEAEAMKVIRGDYGVGQERKDKLGEKYQPIQNRVNELKREGVF